MKDLLNNSRGEIGLSVTAALLAALVVGGAEMRQAKLDARWKTQRAAQVKVDPSPIPQQPDCLIPRDVLLNPNLTGQLTKNCELIKVVEPTKVPVTEVQEKKPLISKENEKKTLEFLEELRKELEKRNAKASKDI